MIAVITIFMPGRSPLFFSERTSIKRKEQLQLRMSNVQHSGLQEAGIFRKEHPTERMIAGDGTAVMQEAGLTCSAPWME